MDDSEGFKTAAVGVTAGEVEVARDLELEAGTEDATEFAAISR